MRSTQITCDGCGIKCQEIHWEHTVRDWSTQISVSFWSPQRQFDYCVSCLKEKLDALS